MMQKVKREEGKLSWRKGWMSGWALRGFLSREEGGGPDGWKQCENRPRVFQRLLAFMGFP